MSEIIGKNIKNTISNINDLLYRKKFNNYIEYMVFPHYKNLVEDSRINLDFPMTILVGKNGSGKSSTLHAFYGAPKNKSVGYFWFSTSLDPITETGDKNRNRFFYGYRENESSEIQEVRKSRIKRSESVVKKEDLDYWETTKPSIKDGMKSEHRNEPVNKDVIYIDFRREMSAFDKYFYFGKATKGETRQDFLRKRAKFLKNLFDTKNPSYYRPKKDVVKKDVIELSEKEVKIINEILNKKYTNVKMVDHKLFDFWGTSIFVRTNISNYSEANAGSGEIAIIKLVHNILNAKPFSLILLDEPEVSLHPSAQYKLKMFLLQEIVNKKHQIVISSHSHVFIENMPFGSLKLFEATEDGKFEIKNYIQPTEAFYSIDEFVEDKISIICEDEAAKIMLELVAEKINKVQFFDIKYYSGGAETIFSKYIPVYCMDNDLNRRVFIFFDGDKFRKACINPSEIKIGVSSADLENEVRSLTECGNIKASTDGSSGVGRSDQKFDFYLKYIKYLYNNVKYFPINTIPELILLESIEGKKKRKESSISEDVITVKNAKEIIRKISMDMFGKDTSEYCINTIRYLTNQWIKEEEPDEYFAQIRTGLESIYNSFNAIE